MIANYHTHTRWCNHGQGEIEDYIKMAIELGFEEIAMTEHIPHRDNSDPFRMAWEDFEDYNLELDKVIDKYKNKIKIIKGFEAEYYLDALDDYEIFREKYGYELFVLGQHRSGKKREKDNFGPKGPKDLLQYAKEVREALYTGIFAFVAHPDLALEGYNDNQWDDTARKAMSMIFQACEDLDIPIEINGNGIRNGRRYPDKDAFELSKNYNLRYILNSDAHAPKELLDSSVIRGKEFANELGVDLIEKLDFQKKRYEGYTLENVSS